MFVPVACLKCGKIFQAPAAAAGTTVACPWCQALTAALPVAGIPQTEPLSLDDDPVQPPAVPRRKRTPWPWPVTAIAVVIVMAIVLIATLAILRYGSGTISTGGWVEFTPPDGSCSIELPGVPAEERVEPTSADGITRGLQQYTAEGWYSRAKVWFGWRDLDPAWVKQATLDRDGAITSPVLAAERDRRKRDANGSIVKEAHVRFGPHTGLEVEMATPRGKLVERYVLALAGAHPRLYFMGIEAKTASVESPAARKLFDSFRVK